MKKLKLLPSVLMLVLCVGVLCMGIYAASPNSNQITGSITINPAGASVDIKAWAEKYDGTKSSEITLTGLRTGGEVINFTNRATFGDFLKLDFGSADEIGDVKPCYIKIEITNNSSTKELGAYISRESMSAQAQKANIFTSQAMTNNSAVTATSLEFYKQMGVANANNNSDTVTLVLEFKANAFIESSDAITFDDYYVNIEEYNPNMTGETLTDTSSGFIKISSTIESAGAQSLSTTKTPRTTISSTSGFRNLTTPADLWVVVPNGVETIGVNSFYRCTALTKISLPSTLISVGTNGLNSSNLVLTYLPVCVTTFTENSFPESFYTSTAEGDISYKGVPGNPNYFATAVIDKTLLNYTINTNTKKLSNSLFSNCVGLTNLPTIPTGITEIPYGCFNNCTGLTGTLTIPEGITDIGDNAFYGCSGISSLVLPDTLKNVGHQAFYETGITVTNESGTEYLSANDNPYFVLISLTNYSGSQVTFNSTTKIVANKGIAGVIDFATEVNAEIIIPSSVVSLGTVNFNDMRPSKITVKAGESYLVSATLPNYVMDAAMEFCSYSLTWYLTEDYSGDPVTHITDQPNDVTYYCKVERVG